MEWDHEKKGAGDGWNGEQLGNHGEKGTGWNEGTAGESWGERSWRWLEWDMMRKELEVSGMGEQLVNHREGTSGESWEGTRAPLPPVLLGRLWALQLLSFPFVRPGTWEGTGCHEVSASKRSPLLPFF